MRLSVKLISLDLVVPGLCGPLPDTDLLKINRALLSLGRLLARADRFRSNQQGFHPEISALFGLQDLPSLPSAVLSLLGESRAVDSGHWFHADPVHLQADMDHAILRDGSSLDLTQDESNALVEEVNTHFSEDGISVVALDQNHWFLNISDKDQIETTPLHDVIGRNVNFYFPKGDDERFWKRFLNEVQMLFHMSDVNKQREGSGLLPVNSLWLWGGGEKPQIRQEFNNDIYSNNPLVKGLAVVHDAKCYPADDVNSLIGKISDNVSSLVVLDDVYVKACYGDISAWQDAMDVIYESWIEPLVVHAMKRKIAVRLHPCNGFNYLISPANKYRFFRKVDMRDHISVYE